VSVAPAVGAVSSAVFSPADGDLGKRPDGTCGDAMISPWAPYNRVHVEVSNPTAQTATVSIFQSKAPSSPDLEMVMWIYKNTLPPGDEASVIACDIGVATDCIAGNPCGNPNPFLFAGLSNVVIPPHGKILVYNAGWAPPIEGPFTFNVRTDALQ
jgi:hypothetical protein